MTDLHTHILPYMDDGAKEPGEARALLEQQLRQGVDRIALTSHYLCEQEPLEAFLERREAAFDTLEQVCPEGLTLKRGCEVFFSPELLELDVRPLCLEGTNVLLLELPVMQKPAFLRETLTGLRAQGIVPMLAHVERYLYVQKDPALAAQWRDLGALIQLNAQSLTENGIAMRLVKWGLADVVASDAHSVRYRPANLKKGLAAVSRALGPETARALERNAALLFCGNQIPKRQCHVPKKVLGFWL